MIPLPIIFLSGNNMKETTILIKGGPFTYRDEWGDPYVFNPATPQDMLALLRMATTLLNDCGIRFFLAYGTLLGAVREGSIINGDDDIDLIVTDEEKLFNSLPYLYEHGLFINRIFSTELYTFHSDGRKGHLDIYIMRSPHNRLYNSWCVSISGHYLPKRFFGEVDYSQYQIDGEFYPCPENPENLLKWLYGRSWRTPKSKKGKSGVFLQRLAQFPRRFYGKVKRKLKHILQACK